MQVDETPKRLAARRRLKRRGLIVIYEDNHLLGVAKPAGMLSQGGPTGERCLTDWLDAYRREAEGKPGRAYIGLVHRLDRNVSGAMVVARTSKAAARLSACFRDRVPELRKSYLAWCQGIPQEASAELVHRLRREGGVTKLAGDGDPDGRDARLAYEIEARGRDSSRLRVRLHSGLPHQIRAQLSHVGHALYGDVKYVGPHAKRVSLHAIELVFAHPVGGGEVCLGAPIPDDLRKLDARLEMDPPV